MRKYVSFIVLMAFLCNAMGPIPYAQGNEFILPAPGELMDISPSFDPPILKGIKVDPNNPFKFEFILDRGDRQPGDMFKSELKGTCPQAGCQASEPLNVKAPQGNHPNDDQELRAESSKLIKYFLASLTIPDKDLWVNLSPYEKDRIIPEFFSQTEMGRDLLAEDYILKQITASLIYPEGAIGKKFWHQVYAQAAQRFKTTNIPVNTFNKVWIVPDRALVYENVKAGTAFVVESKLKVMLEEDYLAMAKNEMPIHGRQSGDMFKSELQGTCLHGPQAGHSQLLAGCPAIKPLNVKAPQGNNRLTNELGSQIVREIIIPELTKEINEDKNFIQLRQVYNSLILAIWYKKKVRESIINQIYSNKNKTSNLVTDPQVLTPEKIYQRYLQAFKKGVFNYIKEEQDPLTAQLIPRKYFSGGMNMAMLGENTNKILELTENSSFMSRMKHKAGFLLLSFSLKALFKVGEFSSKKKIVDSLGDKFLEHLMQPKQILGLNYVIRIGYSRAKFSSRALDWYIPYPENVAEHTWAAAFLVLMFPPDEMKKEDIQRAFEMIILHDIPESLIGDMDPTDTKVDLKFKRKSEYEGFKTLFSIFKASRGLRHE